jgi:hypothetical protein
MKQRSLLSVLFLLACSSPGKKSSDTNPAGVGAGGNGAGGVVGDDAGLSYKWSGHGGIGRGHHDAGVADLASASADLASVSQDASSSHDLAGPGPDLASVIHDLSTPSYDLTIRHDLATAVDLSSGTGGTPSSPFPDTAASIHSFLTFDYQITAAQIPSIGPRTDYVWGADANYVQAWHASNPKIFVSYYIPSNQDPDAQPLSYWKTNHPDWVLYQCDKTTPATAPGYSNIDLDVSNPAVQSYQMGLIKNAAAQGYDGIAFDLFALVNYRAACGIYKNGTWVQLYTGAVHDAKYTADLLAWLQNMYTAMHALPKPMGLVPNYVLDVAPTSAEAAKVIANVDAVLDEEAFGNYGYYTTDSSWVNRMQFLDNLQQAGKAAFPIGGFATVDSSAIQWSLASYLMVKEHHEALYVAASNGAQYGADAYHAEYGAAMGNACGAMASQQSAYTRLFAHGRAIVNPSSTATVTFTLPTGTTYKDLYGAAVSGSVTLGPHSGIVLLTSTTNC